MLGVRGLRVWASGEGGDDIALGQSYIMMPWFLGSSWIKKYV